MKCSKPILLAGTLILAGTTLSHAEGVAFDGAITLGYSFNSIDGIPGTSLDLNGPSIDIDGDLKFSDWFEVGLGFGYSSGDLSVSGLPIDLNVDLISFAIEPVYKFDGGFYVGGYYRNGDLDLGIAGPITVGLDTYSYGLFGGYDFGPGDVEVFLGRSEGATSGIPIGLDVDVKDLGISASYEIRPNLEVFGSYLYTDIDAAGTGFPITAISLGLDYAHSDRLSFYGALGRSDIALTDIGAPSDVDATGLTLGVSYDLSTNAGVPIILSLELSRTKIDGGALLGGIEPEVDRIALGVTIPFGGKSNAKPLNSNTRTARGDYRSAIAAIANAF
ncbi:MAG: porin [Pseudomonadota bacterium]